MPVHSNNHRDDLVVCRRVLDRSSTLQTFLTTIAKDSRSRKSATAGSKYCPSAGIDGRQRMGYPQPFEMQRRAIPVPMHRASSTSFCASPSRTRKQTGNNAWCCVVAFSIPRPRMNRCNSLLSPPRGRQQHRVGVYRKIVRVKK